MLDPSEGEKEYDDTFSRFDTVHQCDKRTDGRTDTGRLIVPRLGITSRDKTEQLSSIEHLQEVRI